MLDSGHSATEVHRIKTEPIVLKLYYNVIRSESWETGSGSKRGDNKPRDVYILKNNMRSHVPRKEALRHSCKVVCGNNLPNATVQKGTKTGCAQQKRKQAGKGFSAFHRT